MGCVVLAGHWHDVKLKLLRFRKVVSLPYTQFGLSLRHD
jgi:hypothetical protein